MALDERKCRILQAIIDDYIASAEPVGSRTIARRYNLGVSPATIRNEMADLEELGYLEQPHTSAGRIPSDKGYRFYVDFLMELQEISEEVECKIRESMKARTHAVEAIIQQTTKLLANLTNYTAVALAPKLEPCAFKHVQFVPVDGETALLVLVSDSGLVVNKLIQLPACIKIEELGKIANVLNERLPGLTIDKIKSSLIREMAIVANRRIAEHALELLFEGINSCQEEERVFMSGTMHILNQPEFRDVSKVKALLSILEQEKLISDLLTNSPAEGVVVTIGTENRVLPMQDCSIVVAHYQMEGRTVGALGIIGPTRMEYGRTISMVEIITKHLSEILTSRK